MKGLGTLLPVAGFVGLVGIVTSVVGFSVSNPRSTKSANVNPAHKWIITKIPKKISAEFECSTNKLWDVSAKINKSVTATLSWDLDLNDDDRKSLERRGKIEKKANINIVRKDTKKELWPITTGVTMQGEVIEKLRVWVYPSSKEVLIDSEFSNVPKQTTGLVQTLQGSFGKLKCQVTENMIPQGDGGFIFGKDAGLGGTKRKIHEIPLDVEITLGRCKSEGGKRDLECSLKVMSKSLFDWSEKVNSQVIITLSK